MHELTRELELRGPALTAAAIARMYEDRFWLARFGVRGRRFADQDGGWHLRHLVEALRCRDPDVLTRYAVWLQGVLTARGMCTLHVDRNFALLGEEIAGEVPGSGEAVKYLDRARAALLYPAGPERDLLLAAPDVLADARAAMRGQRPYLDQHLSYLADSLHLNRPELFTAYVDFMRRFLERGQLARELTALRAAVAERVPGAETSQLLVALA
jgi:hypothetical protein